VARAKKQPLKKQVEALTHEEAKRLNIPTAEYQPVMDPEEQSPIRVAYERRNRDLDPQLVWRGKDYQDWSDLVVQAPPLYIQEKVHPKAIIDDLRRHSENGKKPAEFQMDLFADFNGLPEGADRTDFYQHEGRWTNRMILGDSLQVMASLAEREGLRGKVQCIYIDPPYGIKFNSNFQWSTTSRDVRDGNPEHITREPEQVKAFRDTWRDGIHSYLTYLRDRLTVARDLLTDSGSVFVQIGDENVHRVRALMDEVFGAENFCREIIVAKASALSSTLLPSTNDFILWYAKTKDSVKYREAFNPTDVFENPHERYICVETPDGDLIDLSLRQKQRLEATPDGRLLRIYPTYSQTGGPSSWFSFEFQGRSYRPPGQYGWQTNQTGLTRLAESGRLTRTGNSIGWKAYFDGPRYRPFNTVWSDLRSGGFGENRIYVVQTDTRIVQRCILTSTDPGDLVLDPTCGSGTTAFVSEQWGRRWITADTSRVSLALTRARIMGARYSFYLLADSEPGRIKEAELRHTLPSSGSFSNDLRHGFVYERVPRITLKAIANNTEIDVIWDKFQESMEPLREQLNAALRTAWREWEVPREADEAWPAEAKALHAEWWQGRFARQKEIDASIAAHAEFEYLYDKPYVDNRKVRVAGPFTVESLLPHRVLPMDDDEELRISDGSVPYGEGQDFASIILENLRMAGVQQAHKEDKIDFISVTPWPGHYVCAEGAYDESGTQKRAGIFIGPEFGTVTRVDLVEAAKEAGDAGFDVLIACAFNYDAHSTEFSKLGRIPVLKARMNADLHMSDDLKNTGKGNLFVVFGEPDISILDAGDEGEPGQIRVKINGVDVFHPSTGEVRSDGPEGIACWFIDTDYDQESFFVRHAYFLGANDPYKALKTTLKAEINEEAWASLNSDISRPFDKPASGRIAVKVINHLGDEVMKVFKVS
jgi:adenine-specific DNA-methyltransferase